MDLHGWSNFLLYYCLAIASYRWLLATNYSYSLSGAVIPRQSASITLPLSVLTATRHEIAPTAARSARRPRGGRIYNIAQRMFSVDYIIRAAQNVMIFIAPYHRLQTPVFLILATEQHTSVDHEPAERVLVSTFLRSEETRRWPTSRSSTTRLPR